MTSSAWKQVERMVAAVLGGVRSWDTDHDVLIPLWSGIELDGSESGAFLLEMSRKRLVGLASVEVKNLTAPTVAQLEAFLAKNAEKMARDGLTERYANALVIKRRAGRGRKTPYLLVMPLEVPE